MQQLTVTGSVLAYALVLIAVFFLMLLLVRERRREMGTLKALGVPAGSIVVSLLAEAIAFTLIGALLCVGAFALTDAGVMKGLLLPLAAGAVSGCLCPQSQFNGGPGADGPRHGDRGRTASRPRRQPLQHLSNHSPIASGVHSP
ncbi:ABC transporter permease [Halovibrio sp. HP20-50]|uniref:ABC transporter permease n=1 Tax=Halovibrio sp. HP20-59 TaxID=3080275 RepID=UPI00294B95A9|nr:ABC transporter permease [Halovibrio sp. HP20-59]MEA2118781.1 ABC transporter permease [Halovibrio sp. HP20-59]